MSSPVQNRLFRRKALERLSSPEQLDHLIIITDARGWVALLVLAFLLAALSAWSFLGSIPTDIDAQGLLISRGGRVTTATAPAEGTLAGLAVAVGDDVEKGQVLARITQAQLDQTLTTVGARIQERQTALRLLEESFAEELRLKTRNFEQRRQALNQTIEAAASRAQYLQNKLELQEESAKLGFVAKQTLQETRTALSAARQDIANARVGVTELDAALINIRLRQQRERDAIRAEIAQAQGQARELEARLKDTTVVTAPAAGRVTELKLPVGAPVTTGQPIVALETAGEGLEAIVYIPTQHGKKVRPGMTARVSPATVKKEEHGTMLASVAEISDFPVTTDAMLSVLQNDRLVAAFSQDGAPYAARLDLRLDAATPSGYAWTSGLGPPVRLSSGTTIEVQVTVREQRPIALVIPLFKKASGIYW